MYQTEDEKIKMGIRCLKLQIEEMELLMWEIENKYLNEEDGEDNKDNKKI